MSDVIGKMEYIPIKRIDYDVFNLINVHRPVWSANAEVCSASTLNHLYLDTDVRKLPGREWIGASLSPASSL